MAKKKKRSGVVRLLAGCAVVSALFCVASLLLGGFIWILYDDQPLSRLIGADPFHDVLKKRKRDPSGFSPQAGRPIGKVIIVNEETNKIDQVLTDLLPKEMKATRPEELDAIVEIKASRALVGFYTNGGRAEQAAIHVTIMDMDGKRLHRKSIYGPRAPETIKVPQRSNLGNDPGFPWDDMIDYLTKLPRK